MRPVLPSRTRVSGLRLMMLSALVTVACSSPTESVPADDRPGDPDPTVGWTLAPICMVGVEGSRPLITGAQLLLGTRVVRVDRFAPKFLVPLSTSVGDLASGRYQLTIRITGLTVPSVNVEVHCDAIVQHPASPFSYRSFDVGQQSVTMQVGDVVTFPVEIPRSLLPTE